MDLIKKSEYLENQIKKHRFLNDLDLKFLRGECFDSMPFRHICIDGMWNENFLSDVADEVENISDWEGEKNFYGSMKKRWQSDWNKLPNNTVNFLSLLSQPLILNIIEFITGEQKLIPDPYLTGGGVHSTGENGFLKLHADFNWNENFDLYRRINILVYLNKNWKSEYGGQIELYGKNTEGEFINGVALDPTFNRTLIFVTDDESYHGQPNPVLHPQGKRRNSIAAYYYAAQKPEGSAGIKRDGTSYIDDQGKLMSPNIVKKIAKRLLKR